MPLQGVSGLKLDLIFKKNKMNALYRISSPNPSEGGGFAYRFILKTLSKTIFLLITKSVNMSQFQIISKRKLPLLGRRLGRGPSVISTLVETFPSPSQRGGFNSKSIFSFLKTNRQLLVQSPIISKRKLPLLGRGLGRGPSVISTLVETSPNPSEGGGFNSKSIFSFLKTNR